MVHNYKGYQFRRNGTKEYPWNVYGPKFNPYLRKTEELAHVGFARTLKDCKHGVDSGLYKDDDKSDTITNSTKHNLRRVVSMKMYTKRTPIKASKDFADLKGMDFTKARDLLTKDGFYEHEYGDKDNNNGYAVYRKGDKEVELQYRWIPGKRKGDAHAGKVTNVYVDEDINSATKVRSRRAIKAGYSPKEILWVLDDDNTWKCWGSVGPKMKSMSDAELLDSLNSRGNNYIDVLITKNGENPDEYGRTESVKDPFIRESTRIRSRRTIKASTAPKRYEVAIDRGENESLLVKFFDNKDDAYRYADSVYDRGFSVRITDNETGESEELGEFESYWNTMTDVESCDNSVTASELSLNLGAKPRWEEWVAYGYDVNGEDVTTDSIAFQDDFRSFITDMFRRYPEIDTIDVYKRGSSDNDEYFQTFTRDDVRDMLADAVWNIQHGDVESSVCASTSNQIPYDMVSTLVILRDYANVEDEDYINNEHKLLVDIADTLYNVGRGMVANLSGEYKNLYEMYGEDYFDKVLDDVSAIDSQMSDQNLNDLIEDYNNRIATY